LRRNAQSAINRTGQEISMGFSTRSLAAGAAILMVFGLGPQAVSPPRTSAERGVRRALIRLNGLLARRDTAVVDEFVAADDTLLIGPMADERARGIVQIADYFQQLFANAETISFAWREVDVSVRGDVAWLHAEGQIIRRTDAGEERRPYRLAAVLEPHGARWRWRLFQGSEPASPPATA
jgi:ketosteroid isomerase-like protein